MRNKDQIMKTISILLLLVLSIPGYSQTNKEPIDYVDCFIGTSNSRWMLGPYAGRPFGMVQLGPDNQNDGWMAGYEFSISNVSGFSHIHAWTMCGLIMMPQVQDPTFKDRPVDAPYRGAGASYHSRMLKETEKAFPGYYAVELYVKAELTATTHCGFHKYTFNDEYDNARILIDLLFPAEYVAKLADGEITIKDKQTITGYSKLISSYNEWTLHFEIRFNKAFNSMNGWTQREGEREGVEKVKGQGDLASYVTFNVKKEEPLMAKVGLSLVSAEGARKNLEQELEDYDWDFNRAVKDARNEWNELLGRIKVEGGTQEDKVKFYTNLYRSYCQKQTWSDVDGKYVDPFEQVQQLPEGGVMYGGDAFWNTFWNLNTLWSLISPEIMKNWVDTQLELFDKTGWTNNGPTGLEHTGVMEVTHEVVLMISAWQKRIWKGDEEKLYKAVRNVVTKQGEILTGTGLAGNDYLNVFVEKGYVPYNLGRKSRTDRTLNYAFDFYCVAQMAKALGKYKDYDDFMKKSEYWRNIFHSGKKYIVPKDTLGNWLDNFDPLSGYSFTEGNSWQYTWYIPHNVSGLIDAMGGEEVFNKRLENGFRKSEKKKFAAHAFDRSRKKAIEYYINHGNEANMQPAYLFNYSGKPHLTQKYTRAILNNFYGSTPYHGWEGDEDEGQMGGWYVISAMGLFEMTGGVEANPMVNLTSPLFNKVTIKLDNAYYLGKTFIVEAKNNSEENIYIQGVKLNGKKVKKPFIPFKEIVNGGKLEFDMGPKPAKW
jgi:predicted alpha-1,2-mannosidase